MFWVLEETDWGPGHPGWCRQFCPRLSSLRWNEETQDSRWTRSFMTPTWEWSWGPQLGTSSCPQGCQSQSPHRSPFPSSVWGCLASPRSSSPSPRCPLWRPPAWTWGTWPWRPSGAGSGPPSPPRGCTWTGRGGLHVTVWAETDDIYRLHSLSASAAIRPGARAMTIKIASSIMTSWHNNNNTDTWAQLWVMWHVTQAREIRDVR